MNETCLNSMKLKYRSRLLIGVLVVCMTFVAGGCSSRHTKSNKGSNIINKMISNDEEDDEDEDDDKGSRGSVYHRSPIVHSSTKSKRSSTNKAFTGSSIKNSSAGSRNPVGGGTSFGK